MHKWVLGVLLLAVLVACPTETYYTVTATAGAGGKVSPTSQKVLKGTPTTVAVTPDTGFNILEITGTCGGIAFGGTFNTSIIKADCSVIASFKVAPPTRFTVTATAGAGGAVSPASQQVNVGAAAVINVTPNAGYVVNTATGCGGTINAAGTTYNTATINADCAVNVSFKIGAPTNGSTNFPVTGLGAPQASRTSNYRISALPTPAGGRPLVIWLHRNNSLSNPVPTAYATWTDPQAAVLVAPQGINGFWNFRMDGRDAAGTQPDVDDVAFIEALIARATNSTTPLFGTGNVVNPSKVFVVGEGAGATMAYYLYADTRTQNLIAAIAPFSGTLYCQTSDGGNGTLPYIPPADSDLNCGEDNGAGYFVPRPALYNRTSPPRIFDLHATNDLPETPPPALDDPFGTLVPFINKWAITSNNCGSSLPSASPVFTANIEGLKVDAYRQRNQSDSAPCPADVTFYFVENGGHVPQGYAERVIQWFFGKYNTLTNTFNP
jgi:hypothetical protein